MDEQNKIYEQLLQAQDQSKTDIEEARKQKMYEQLAANLGAAGSQIGAGFATIGGRQQYNPNLSQFENLNKQASERFGTEQDIQKSKLEQLRDRLNTYQKIKEDERARSMFGLQSQAAKMNLEKGGMELEQLRHLQKSDTPEAILGQALIQEKYKDALGKAGIGPEQLKGLSPARLEAMKSVLKLGTDDNDLYKMLGLQQRQMEASQRQEERDEKRIEKGLDKVSTRIERAQIIPMTQSLNNINDVLRRTGGNIDKPAKGDLPGIGFFDSAKPDLFTSREGIDLRQNVQSLANTLLKTRSGSAVSDPEFKRFLQEASIGKFSTEKNTMAFVKKMKDLVHQEAKNIESGVPKEALDVYAEQFGAKPTELIPGKHTENKPKTEQKNSNMVRIELPDGRKGSVPREKLPEAIKRGAKVLE